MTFHQYKPYKSSVYQPRAVIYLDEVFRTQHFWHDWVVTKTMMEIEAKACKKARECSLEEARIYVWTQFVQRIQDETTNIGRISKDSRKALKRIDIPNYFCHLTIAKWMLAGKRKTEAVKEFKKWLDEDPNNGVVYEMKLNSDFTVTIINQDGQGKSSHEQPGTEESPESEASSQPGDEAKKPTVNKGKIIRPLRKKLKKPPTPKKRK